MNNIMPIILIIVGATLCFGGIYLRNFFSGLMGFIWGSITILCFELLLGLSSDIAMAMIMIIFGGICAVFCYFFTKIATAIIGFFTFGMSAFILLLLVTQDLEAIAGIILVAVLIGAVGVCIAIKIDKYIFIVGSAFIGAFLAVTGVFCLMAQITVSQFLEELLLSPMWGSTVDYTVFGFGVLILGIVGMVSQIAGLEFCLKGINDGVMKTDFAKLKLLWMENWVAIVIPFVVIFLPIFYKLIMVQGYNSTVIRWIEDISIAIMLGSLVYFITNYKAKAGLIIAILYDALHIVVNYDSYFATPYGWTIDLTTFRSIATVLILILINHFYKDKEVKLSVFPFLTYVIFDYALSWIVDLELYAMHIDIKYILVLITIYLTVFVLQYKGRRNVIYNSRKSIIILMMIAILSGGIWGYQQWKNLHAGDIDYGGWENYEEERDLYSESDQWTVIDDESEYSTLIDGEINVDQLRRALELFADEVDSEGIDKRFDEDHYWEIFFLCDSEDSIMSENQASTTFIYDLQDVNNTLKGITNFSYKADTTYSENEFTDKEKLYMTFPSMGWEDLPFVKNLRGRYNRNELIIDYDWYEADYDSLENDPHYLYSMRAIFKKNDNGKFKLDRIEMMEE